MTTPQQPDLVQLQANLQKFEAANKWINKFLEHKKNLPGFEGSNKAFELTNQDPKFNRLYKDHEIYMVGLVRGENGNLISSADLKPILRRNEAAAVDLKAEIAAIEAKPPITRRRGPPTAEERKALAAKARAEQARAANSEPAAELGTSDSGYVGEDLEPEVILNSHTIPSVEGMEKPFIHAPSEEPEQDPLSTKPIAARASTPEHRTVTVEEQIYVVREATEDPIALYADPELARGPEVKAKELNEQAEALQRTRQTTSSESHLMTPEEISKKLKSIERLKEGRQEPGRTQSAPAAAGPPALPARNPSAPAAAVAPPPPPPRRAASPPEPSTAAAPVKRKSRWKRFTGLLSGLFRKRRGTVDIAAQAQVPPPTRNTSVFDEENAIGDEVINLLARARTDGLKPTVPMSPYQETDQLESKHLRTGEPGDVEDPYATVGELEIDTIAGTVVYESAEALKPQKAQSIERTADSPDPVPAEGLYSELKPKGKPAESSVGSTTPDSSQESLPELPAQNPALPSRKYGEKAPEDKRDPEFAKALEEIRQANIAAAGAESPLPATPEIQVVPKNQAAPAIQPAEDLHDTIEGAQPADQRLLDEDGYAILNFTESGTPAEIAQRLAARRANADPATIYADINHAETEKLRNALGDTVGDERIELLSQFEKLAEKKPKPKAQGAEQLGAELDALIQEKKGPGNP